MEKDKDSNHHEKDANTDRKSSKSNKSVHGDDKIKDSAEHDKHDTTHATDKVRNSSNLAKFFSKGSEDTVESLENHAYYNEEAVENANLSEEEVHEATLAIVDGRTQEVAEELYVAESDSVEEFEALAGAVYYESLQDLAENSDDMTREMIEQAYQESLEDLSISPGDMSELDYLQPVQGAVQENEGDINGPVDLPDVPPTATSTHPAQSMVPNNLLLDSSITPPTNLNSGFTTQNLIAGNYINQNLSGANQNTQPVIITEVHNHRNNVLLGAVIGYMIGRRGGRKRAEKKLLPRIDNLQKQVTLLHDIIIEKEVKIRKLARESLMNARQPIETGVLVERRKLRKEVKETLRRREELISKPGVEKIGKFSLPALKVFHERRLPDGTENSPKRIQVEVMTETELLEKVAGLSIHGLNVADIYRKKRLTLESLRQITKEYLRGGPFKQTFALELLPDEKEILEKRERVRAAHPSSSSSQNQTQNEYHQGVVSDNSKTNDVPKQLIVSSVSHKTKISIKSGILTGIILAAIVLASILLN